MKIIIDVPEETYKFIMEHYGGYPGGVWDSWDAIKAGEPVNKTGSWVRARCSNCGNVDVEEPNYCSRCGSLNGGEGDE